MKRLQEEHYRVLLELCRRLESKDKDKEKEEEQEKEKEVVDRRWSKVREVRDAVVEPESRLAPGCGALREVLMSEFRLTDPRDPGEQERQRAREALRGRSSSESREGSDDGDGELVAAEGGLGRALDGFWLNRKPSEMDLLLETPEDAGKLDLMLAHLKEDPYNIELAAGCVYRLNLLYESVPCLRRECRVQINSLAPSMYCLPCGPEEGFGPLHLLAELLPSRQTVPGASRLAKIKDTSLTLRGELQCLANLLEQYPSAPQLLFGYHLVF